MKSKPGKWNRTHFAGKYSRKCIIGLDVPMPVPFSFRDIKSGTRQEKEQSALETARCRVLGICLENYYKLCAVLNDFSCCYDIKLFRHILEASKLTKLKSTFTTLEKIKRHFGLAFFFTNFRKHSFSFPLSCRPLSF